MKNNHLKIILPAVLLGLSATESFAASTPLMRTGQTSCYDAYGTLIDCSGTGQDGDILSGVPLKKESNRFKDQGDGTIKDTQTGLMWLKDTTCLGNAVWVDQLWTIWTLNAGWMGGCQDYTATYTDWKMPNINEYNSLKSLEESDFTYLADRGFVNLSTGSWMPDYSRFWSSTTYALNTEQVWTFSPSDTTYLNPVVNKFSTESLLLEKMTTLAVRRYSWTPVSTARTGQKTARHTWDDGYFQQGVQWSSPRFEDKEDGTVIDYLTGISWSKDANAPGPAACNPGTFKTWQQGLDYAACLNSNAYLGFTDWRIPNIRELESLYDYEHSSLPIGHPFINAYEGPIELDGDCYISSTTLKRVTRDAKTVCFGESSLILPYTSIEKTLSARVWPVHGAVWFEDRQPEITYTGTWSENNQEKYSNSTSMISTEAGARVEFSFYGTGIKWMTFKNSDQGIVNVYLDGDYLKTVDLYRDIAWGWTWQAVLQNNLVRGNHTISIEVTGTKNPGASDNMITVDAFLVVP